MNLTDVKCKTNRYAVVGSSGYVGRPLADYLFGHHGFSVIRIDEHSNDKEYKKANIFFVAVPTPTVLGVFVGITVESVIKKMPKHSLVIIRSTVPASFVRRLITQHPDKSFVVVPEFLDADNATWDFSNPHRLVIGVDRPEKARSREIATFVLKLLPGNTNKDYNYFLSIEEACLVKYAANAFFLTKNVFFGLVYEIAALSGMDHQKILEAISDDPRIGTVHAQVPHKGGRGAGGGCLVKDFEVFRNLFAEKWFPENDNRRCFLRAASGLNKHSLKVSGKNPEIVKEVFGE